MGGITLRWKHLAIISTWRFKQLTREFLESNKDYYCFCYVENRDTPLILECVLSVVIPDTATVYQSINHSQINILLLWGIRIWKIETNLGKKLS